MTNRDSDIAGMMLELSRLIRRKHAQSKGVNFLRSHALCFITDHGSVTLTEFSKGMNISPSTASVFIGRLEKLKLVVRTKNPANKRQVHINLSAMGKKAVKDTDRRKQKILADLFSVLSDKDRNDLNKILSTILLSHNS